MNENIEFKTVFRGVGQGLFYTGKIGNFNFVYDCGSNQKRDLMRAIELYKRDMRPHEDTSRRRINLLIVSHFHYDHTNGLDKLLEDVELEDVVIPYFTPIERLILALRRKNLPEWYSDWYPELLRNPVSFFLIEKKARRVIIIGREGREGLPEYKGPSRDEKVDFEEMPDDEKLKKLILMNDPSWEKFMKDGRLLVKNHNIPFVLLGWIFRFFNYKPEEKNMRRFQNCIDSKGIKPSNSTFIEDIKDAITDSSKRIELKSCYNHLHRDLNNTSLVVYHGPLGKYKCKFHVSSKYGLLFDGNQNLCISTTSRPCSFSNENQMGQFLTGDINLNHDYGQIKTHYHNLLNRTSICQIPHHGSWKNWNRTFLEELENCGHWVASSGFSIQYGHPHISIVRDIISKNCSFYWCNQGNQFMTEGVVKW